MKPSSASKTAKFSQPILDSKKSGKSDPIEAGPHPTSIVEEVALQRPTMQKRLDDVAAFGGTLTVRSDSTAAWFRIQTRQSDVAFTIIHSCRFVTTYLSYRAFIARGLLLLSRSTVAGASA